MTINGEHIVEAENIFIYGKRFDEERSRFINNLTSCDLLAVPGSGKTTALLAKLYALSKQLPLEDGSGILVLAHTNASVFEIENKLKAHSPKLFEYPNFVGTVQGFVNKFLASPANFIKYGSYLSKVDDEIANGRLLSGLNKLPFTSPLRKYLFFQLYGQLTTISANYLIDNFKTSAVDAKNFIKMLRGEKILTKNGFSYQKVKSDQAVEELPNIDSELKDIVKKIHKLAKKKIDEERCNRALSYRLDLNKRCFFYGNNKLSFDSDSGNELFNHFEIQLRQGIVRYKDCYSLADWLLDNNGEIAKQLQSRFKFVFIDEMQDLEGYQIELVDRIFYGEESNTIMQRIGDINQSIYSSGKKVKIECDWKPRNMEYLNGSNRLTAKNARLVNSFTLDTQNGQFRIESQCGSSNFDIPPHLVVFRTQSQNNLKYGFAQLVNEYGLKQLEEAKYGFKIVGWTGKSNESADKLNLHSLFGFEKEMSITEEYRTLSAHIQSYGRNNPTLEGIRKSILNALIAVLRMEKKKIGKTIRGSSVERFYTKNDLIDFIKDHNREKAYFEAYEDFKEKLFIWCFDLITKEEYQNVYSKILEFINKEFRSWFDLSLNSQEVSDFLGNNFKAIDGPKVDDHDDMNSAELSIEINTIHSVKGQTHCATMYVETFYHQYESKKKGIIDALLHKTHSFKVANSVDKRGMEALKMMYVGFSRPTHLLCFAMHEDRVLGNLEYFRNAGWTVIHI